MNRGSTTFGKPVVGLHRGPRVSDSELINSNGLLYDLLAENAYPVFTRGKDTLDKTSGLFVAHYRIEGDISGGRFIQNLGSIAVNSARDFSQGLDGELFPILNHPDIRDLCGDKWRVYELNADLQAQTVRVDAASSCELQEALAALVTSKVVVKRVKGRGSKQTFIGDKVSVTEQVEAALASGELTSRELLVQEYIDTTHLPRGIRGANELQRHKLGRANGPKEIRIYMIDERPELAVLRVANDEDTKMGTDEWVFIDQDSLPSEALACAQTVASRLRVASNQQDSLLAVDLVWNSAEGRWQLMECNGRYPASIRCKDAESKPWAYKQQGGIARKLTIMALRSKLAIEK